MRYGRSLLKMENVPDCSTVALAAAMLLGAFSACGATEIRFWHSMGDEAGQRVADLARGFNESQGEFRVVPEYRDDYEASLAAGTGVIRGPLAPHVVQISAARTATLSADRSAFKPLFQLMAESREKLDARAFLPAISAYYADRHGRLLSLPFNSSAAIFYYNRDAFRRGGADPDRPPQTWREIQAVALKLRDSDASPCAYTTGWQSWVLLESLAARHNEPFATRDNGYAGADAQLNFNGELLIRHIALLSSWAKSGLFTYAGRTVEGEARFASGECAMLTTDSSSYRRIAAAARFDFAVSPLPYYDEFEGAPYNAIPRGGSLWATSGKKAAEYKGVAKFFSYIARPEVQAEWSRRTGTLPNTAAAHELNRKSGYYDRNPGAAISVAELNRRPHAYSRGLHLGNMVRIRAVIDEELESVWLGRKTPKEALDEAVERGNVLLRTFERAAVKPPVVTRR